MSASLPSRFRTLAGDARRRHWLRVSLLLILVVVPGLYGWLNRPPVQEAPDLVGPSVVVLANQSGVAATVNMVLSVGLGDDERSSKLQLTVLPTSNISGTVRLTVELNDFPSGTKGASGTPRNLPVIQAPGPDSVYGSLAQAAPSPPPGYQDYAVTEPAAPMAPTIITIVAEKATIGEAEKGAQLRVAFPDLVGEAPGANPSVGYPLQYLYSGAGASQGSSGNGYPLALQAGTSTFSAGGTRLSDYQILTGDSPVLLGSGWHWNGVNDVTVLAANVGTEDQQQHDLFYSGIALGLAAGAVIALLVELIPAESAADPQKSVAGPHPADAKADVPPG
jgi:hypothetical protein